MDDLLRALPYLGAMAAVVPLAGFFSTGSWRAAWRYTLTWWRVIAVLVFISAALLLGTSEHA